MNKPTHKLNFNSYHTDKIYVALEAGLQKHYQEHGLSKEEYLDSIDSIINEAPDLFAALQNDHFD